MKLLTRPTRLALNVNTAADLMVGNPLSLRADATLKEAMALFTSKGISAAPVIDDAGRPIGVLSRSDIIVHESTLLEWGPGGAAGDAPLVAPLSDTAKVRDSMTPAIFSVEPDTPAATVVKRMLQLNVHRLFVVDHHGILVGVISALDVLRQLRTED